MNLETKVVVANTGESSLSIIDPMIRKEIRRIPLLSGAGPYDIIKSSQDGCILVTQYYEGTVILVEVMTGRVLESIPLGRCPSYMVYNKKEDLAFISNCDSNSISIISVSEMKLIGQISVGSMPRGLDLAPLGNDLMVANLDSRDLWVLNSKDFGIKRKVRLGYTPFYVKYSRDGRHIFISCSDDRNEDTGIIMALDTTTLSVVDTIITNGLPGRLYTTLDGKYLISASLGKGGVEIFKIPEGKLMKKIPTNGMSHSIVLDRKEQYIYVTNTGDNSISIVNLTLGRKVEDIKVGKEPNGIIML